MPRTVKHVDTLQEYIRGVIERAEHHAGDVDEICLAIVGAIIWRKDGELKVLERDGDMKNVLWVEISGTRYAFSYDHEHHQIECREGTTQGPRLAAFTNATPLAAVKDFFAGL